MSNLHVVFCICLTVLSGAWSSTAQANLWMTHEAAARAESDLPAEPSSGQSDNAEHPRILAFAAVDVWDGNAGRASSQAPVLSPPAFLRPGHETAGDLHDLRFLTHGPAQKATNGPLHGYMVCRYPHAPPEQI